MAGQRYYSHSSSRVDYFGLAGRSEPSMRDEFVNTMDGNFPEIAKAQTCLLRRIRRDNSGKVIECSCVDRLTHEPDKDKWCPICQSSGALWDESYMDCYRVNLGNEVRNALLMQIHPFGNVTIPMIVFYIKYDIEIDIRDRIIELQLSIDGTPVVPLARRAIYNIGNVWKYRSDGGRVEYIKVWTTEESVKHLTAPSFGAT